jgi:hypothetical protein
MFTVGRERSLERGYIGQEVKEEDKVVVNIGWRMIMSLLVRHGV